MLKDGYRLPQCGNEQMRRVELTRRIVMRYTRVHAIQIRGRFSMHDSDTPGKQYFKSILDMLGETRHDQYVRLNRIG